MDDPATSPLPSLAVNRFSEPSRLEHLLLADVYHRLFPEVRRSLVDPVIPPATSTSLHAVTATAAHIAAGA
jgi:hypothetical protein